MAWKEPVLLQHLVQNYLNTAPNRKELKRGMILSLWPKIVGKQIAAECRNLRFKGTTLTVHVANAAWRQELHMQRTQILKKLNTELKEEVVSEIIVRA